MRQDERYYRLLQAMPIIDVICRFGDISKVAKDKVDDEIKKRWDIIKSVFDNIERWKREL